MKKVQKNAHGEHILICPHCKKEAHVYHMSWSGLMCNHCKKMVNKKNWYLKK